MLHAFIDIITDIYDTLNNNFFLTYWVSQHDVTELHAGDNAVTCLSQPCYTAECDNLNNPAIDCLAATQKEGRVRATYKLNAGVGEILYRKEIVASVGANIREFPQTFP